MTENGNRLLAVLEGLDAAYDPYQTGPSFTWKVDDYEFTVAHEVTPEYDLDYMFSVRCGDGREYAESFRVPRAIFLSLSVSNELFFNYTGIRILEAVQRISIDAGLIEKDV